MILFDLILIRKSPCFMQVIPVVTLSRRGGPDCRV
jgi:hypothetical protein